MSKPALEYQHQLNLLISRGLQVPDVSFALHILEHHNYYRLSAYRFPFVVSGSPDRFLPTATFNQIWDLYHFDRSLRQLILEGCKRIEISARSRLAYEIGHQLGPLAYLDNQYFSNPTEHFQTLTKLDSEMNRSREEFVRHHRVTLKTYWPPIWVLMEVSSFGTTSKLLANLKAPTLRQKVADTYHLDEKIFCSLFHHLSVLRNIAAHHSRLWNRKFSITFQLPLKKPANLHLNFNSSRTLQGNLQERGIYNSLVLLVHLVQIIEQQSKWPRRLMDTLNSLDQTLLSEMEIPINWKQLPLWAAL